MSDGNCPACVKVDFPFVCLIKVGFSVNLASPAFPLRAAVDIWSLNFAKKLPFSLFSFKSVSLIRGLVIVLG